MAPQFPEIVDYGSALRFALSAEEACGGLATAARELAPLPYWHALLEELIDEHRERIERLTAIRQEAHEKTLEPIRSLDGGAYLDALVAEAGDWPEVVERLIAAEEAAARCHDDLAPSCEGIHGGGAHALKKCAKQDRRAAEELRAMLAR
jgi:hypothetical protein